MGLFFIKIQKKTGPNKSIGGLFVFKKVFYGCY